MQDDMLPVIIMFGFLIIFLVVGVPWLWFCPRKLNNCCFMVLDKSGKMLKVCPFASWRAFKAHQNAAGKPVKRGKPLFCNEVYGLSGSVLFYRLCSSRQELFSYSPDYKTIAVRDRNGREFYCRSLLSASERFGDYDAAVEYVEFDYQPALPGAGRLQPGQLQSGAGAQPLPHPLSRR